MDLGEIRKMGAAFRQRRDFLLGRLQRWEALKLPRPDGAFYLFPDVSGFYGRASKGRVIENAEELCFFLLETHGVALVPGDAFGAPDCVRLSYAASLDDLGTACDALDAAFGELMASEPLV